jgi:predicted MFS family arabinose efflux permease
MIADLFPLERRNIAMAIFSSGASVGLLIGFAIGGWLDQDIGWRATFVVVALPGFLLAAIIRFTLREPPRGRFSVPALETPLNPRSVLLTLWNNRGFRHLAVAYAVGVLLMYGQTQWLPAFFERSFGVHPAQLGAMIALTQGLGTFAGTILGGLICDRLAHSNPLWPMRIAVASGILVMAPRIALYLVSNADEGYAVSAIAGFVGGLGASPLLAIVVTIVPSQIRATASAVLLLMTALIGMGGGPFLIGWLSDMLKPAWHGEALRYSLLSVTAVTGTWVCVHYVFILRYLAERLHTPPAESADLANAGNALLHKK